MKRALPLILFIFSNLAVNAAYYDTLPQGVRLLVLRQVKTGNINSSYGHNQKDEDYFLHQNINSHALHDLNDATKFYFSELKRISEKAYDAFTFGEYEADAAADVNVQGFGFAYGLTPRVTTYATLPYYRANVQVSLNRLRGNNHEEVLELIDNSEEKDDVSNLIYEITRELPDGNGEVLQSILTNYYGYKPIGNWEGEGFGDMELGVIYRLTNKPDYGAAATFGIVLPTGVEDDPDILQDIPFGDGQLDAFMEIGGAIKLQENKLELESSLRFTHQFASTKILRKPESEDIPISEYKGSFREQLGNKVLIHNGALYHVNHWMSLKGSYNLEFIGQATYESTDQEANRLLSLNTDSEVHSLKGELGLSTVKLYQQKKFVLPADFTLMIEQVVRGRNTPKYTRADLEVRFYF